MIFNLDNPDSWAGKIILMILEAVIIAVLLLLFQDFLQRRLFVFQASNSSYLIIRDKQIRLDGIVFDYELQVGKVTSNGKMESGQNEKLTQAQEQILDHLSYFDSARKKEKTKTDFDKRFNRFKTHLEELHLKIIGQCDTKTQHGNNQECTANNFNTDLNTLKKNYNSLNESITQIIRDQLEF